MSKNTKIIIAVILVIFVIILCCISFGGNNDKTNNTNEQEFVNIVEENIIEENVISNESNTDNVINEVEEELVIENVAEIKPQGTVYESNEDIGTTDKKQDAIDLVKQTWGEDDSVTFRCDSIESNGVYIIAVVSKQTASVKNYFKVNLNTKSVEIDY